MPYYLDDQPQKDQRWLDGVVKSPHLPYLEKICSCWCERRVQDMSRDTTLSGSKVLD